MTTFPKMERVARQAAMQFHHLGPALAAIGLLAAMLAGGVVYARLLETRFVHALAPQLIMIKRQGNALAKEAFRQPDLLPIYAGSEFELYRGRFLATEFFHDYPTGFTVFPIGNTGAAPLTMLLEIASVGPELDGKKLVISVSPIWFHIPATLRESVYAGSFSQLQAGELVFSTAIPMDVRRAAAQRMLDYPGTLAPNPLLRFACEKLADPSLLGQLTYLASLPLGRLENLVLSLQDHWEAILYIGEQRRANPDVSRREVRLDWSSLKSQAEQEARAHASNNAFGFDDRVWEAISATQTRPRRLSTDEQFISTVQASLAWADLDLLLRMLRDEGARPLLVSAPLPGLYMDYIGVSASARWTYYKTLRDLAGTYSVPLVDFAAYDTDRYFVLDPLSHPSAKGWLLYDQALDAYYHQRAIR